MRQVVKVEVRVELLVTVDDGEEGGPYQWGRPGWAVEELSTKLYALEKELEHSQSVNVESYSVSGLT